MSINSNPCDECIVLSMCQARVSEYVNYCEKLVIQAQIRSFAENNCEFLKDYLMGAPPDRVNEVRKFYGLETIKDYRA